jgi:hypothetical protein
LDRDHSTFGLLWDFNSLLLIYGYKLRLEVFLALFLESLWKESVLWARRKRLHKKLLCEEELELGVEGFFFVLKSGHFFHVLEEASQLTAMAVVFGLALLFGL